MDDETPLPDDKPRRPRKPARPPRDDGEVRDPDDDRRGDYDEEDEWEDRPRRRRRPAPHEDESLKYVVPLNTSALAIIAGYLGLVSVLLLPAPFALLLGILALRHLKKNPKLDGKGRAIFAVVMGAVFTIFLVFGLIGIAASQFK